MNLTALVTGGTGFVGRQIIGKLSERNISVRAVVRPQSEEKLPVAQAYERIIRSAKPFDEDAEWWTTACRGVDLVIHCAWYSEPELYLQSAVNIDCLRGTLAVARGAQAARVSRFVGIGTCFEYDLDGGVVSVDTPLRPLTPYAGAKAAAYLALSQFLPASGVSFLWCRLFYLYGENEHERRLVPYLRRQLSAGLPAALTSGAQVRDYLDVREAARQIVDAAVSESCGTENICSEKPITVRQMAERIADEYGRRDLLHFGARPDNPMDPACVVGKRCVKRSTVDAG